ncbi:hypothetical protein EYC80_008820 [Monilinia laxa]|uniref:Uncharacterized protein n=1 Tax=Monilinia laxa TaxID=61186 RepID=A0A5N6K1G9_MONLA|nr:hypothetical protein EYC80_008820 [Monilinia laxa]
MQSRSQEVLDKRISAKTNVFNYLPKAIRNPSLSRVSKRRNVSIKNIVKQPGKTRNPSKSIHFYKMSSAAYRRYEEASQRSATKPPLNRSSYMKGKLSPRA